MVNVEAEPNRMAVRFECCIGATEYAFSVKAFRLQLESESDHRGSA
jgi:hypothetical protein